MQERRDLEVGNVIEEQAKTNQHLRKLKEEHTKFLEEFIDNNPGVTLDQMADALNDKLEGFSISKSGVDKHMKESCSYTLKRITKIPAKRSSPNVIEDLELLRHGLKTLTSVLCKTVFSLMDLGSIFIL
ncbi:uncharacterized protein RHIMIDRAFT_302735 [Rhizopus microsporus ATCC 52813]|uniref:Uncharacterized protein n=1 Tax=Rhizopus microsporus ATCC 52813 TaxID=1340429 RepID=A0A2G4T2W8_RHIZD|nr:uncharacterized protein RHIMIDRAFT_302735 [Rhizopus microsporus ATCC 52813]PHZ15344.1 hypothetical protein RHIMIDRAFT_302735 [Rhizopus microsporus ATCC 52813]